MHYETTFSAHIDIRHYEISCRDMAQFFGLEEARVLREKGKTRIGAKQADKESAIEVPVDDVKRGFVEGSIVKACDTIKAATLPADFINEGSIWIVIRLYDQDFVELHFDSEIIQSLAEAGSQISIENRRK